MAGSVNKVTLIGNLGADPESRSTQDGRSIVNMRLATTDSWRDKTSGEKRERTEWHKVVIFNEALGRVAQQYLQKGSKVYIEGSLQTRKWEDKDGIVRYTTEVVLQNYSSQLTLLDSRATSSGLQSQASSYKSPAVQNKEPSQTDGIDPDDDIPF